MNDWPQRPERAGDNSVYWNDMSVEFSRDSEPPEAQDGDRWRNRLGLFLKRDGDWVPMVELLPTGPRPPVEVDWSNF